MGRARCLRRVTTLGLYASHAQRIVLHTASFAEVDEVLLHEHVHRDLIEKTIGGFVERLVAALADAEETPVLEKAQFEDCLQQIWANSWFVHEGLATATGLYHRVDKSAQAFERKLNGLPNEYKEVITELSEVLGPVPDWLPGAEFVELTLLTCLAKHALNRSFQLLLTAAESTTLSEFLFDAAKSNPDTVFRELLASVKGVVSSDDLRQQARDVTRLSGEVSIRALTSIHADLAHAERLALLEIVTQRLDQGIHARYLGTNPMSSGDLGAALESATRGWTRQLVSSQGDALLEPLRFEHRPDNLTANVSTNTEQLLEDLWSKTLLMAEGDLSKLDQMAGKLQTMRAAGICLVLHCYWRAPRQEASQDFGLAVEGRAHRTAQIEAGEAMREGEPVFAARRFPGDPATLAQIAGLADRYGAQICWHLDPDLSATTVEYQTPMPHGLTCSFLGRVDTSTWRNHIFRLLNKSPVFCYSIPVRGTGLCIFVVGLGDIDPDAAGGCAPLRFFGLLPSVSVVGLVADLQRLAPADKVAALRCMSSEGSARDKWGVTAAALFYRRLTKGWSQ